MSGLSLDRLRPPLGRCPWWLRQAVQVGSSAGWLALSGPLGPGCGLGVQQEHEAQAGLSQEAGFGSWEATVGGGHASGDDTVSLRPVPL